MCKSYNFWQNKLMVMKIDEYNSKGAAKAAVDALVDTLGFSQVRLSDILLHFAFNGVYVTTGETCQQTQYSWGCF